MKRRIVLLAALGLGLAGCGSEPPVSGNATAERAWITPPTIATAGVEGSSLVLTGTASPLGRVVLVTPGARVFAAAADEVGRFRLIAPRPDTDTLFTVEVQAGEARYPSPGRLLVAGASDGPIAFVSPGAPTRRFDPAPALDSVDSDGRAIFLSGRAAASSTVMITAGVQRPVVAGEDGRWSVSPVGQPAVVEVDGQPFATRTDLPGEEGLSRDPGGWRLVWATPGGARQTTWFPARAVVGIR